MWVGVIRTEGLFRETNERLSRFYSEFPADSREFICECGNRGCTQGIVLTSAEYDAVRGYPTRFAIAAGHEIEAIERVVAVHERFSVVEKPVSL